MIGINLKDKSIVTDHYNLMRDYLVHRNTMYSYEEINNWVKKITNNEYCFREIIIAESTELEKIIESVSNVGLLNLADRSSEDNKKGKYLIYVYSSFASLRGSYFDSADYSALYMIKKLDLVVCPYCNRNFITNTRILKKDGDDKVRRTAQFDHFHSKSEHPYLALSFYNLIPICSSCNFIKHNNQIKINPYAIVNSDDHIVFDCEFDRNFSRYKVGTSHMSNDFRKSWLVLGLEELYRAHEPYVDDLAARIILYKSMYKDDLPKYFEKWSRKTNISLASISKEDLKRVIIGNHYLEEDLNKHPLSKLTKDIVNKYG